ncbi:hypothetical protein G6666_04970 [Polynucleobacter paneuropaeus]|nr:hypothetical protein [Polynucleobacter paneuropaeus]MBT8533714.1 hypothetical protein [Polynucleobacter paneuropaeus]
MNNSFLTILKDVKIPFKYLLVFGWGFTAYILTISFYEYFYGGDQESYRSLYYSLFYLKDLDAGYELYYGILRAKEPLYFGLIWISSGWLTHGTLTALLNALFAGLVSLWVLKKNISPLVSFLVFFSNYYSFVLFFSAEKLKFGFILFLVCSLFFNLNFLGSLVISIFGHFQMGILLVSEFLLKLFKSKGFKKIFFTIIIIILTISFVYKFFLEILSSKLIYYLNDENKDFLNDLIKSSVYFVITYYIAPKTDKVRALIFGFILIICCLLLGSGRVLIFSYLLFLYYALQINRGYNLFVLASTLYFLVKGYNFLLNGVNNGSGFY